MSDYALSVGLSFTATGERTVEGSVVKDPLKIIPDLETFTTSTANKQLARKAINLTNGQSVTVNPASFTMPLGDSGNLSFVQTWILYNTGDAATAGTLQLTFADSHYIEVEPGAFVMGCYPLREATQRGWDASVNFVVACVGGSVATTGILALGGSPSA